MIRPKGSVVVGGLCLGVLVGFAAAAGGPPLLEAVLVSQERIDLAAFETCEACRLDLEPLAILGEDQAPGDPGEVIGRELLAGPGPTYIVPRRGGTFLQIYGSDGEFLRSIGSPGQGPGELQVITGAAVFDSLLYVSDLSRGRLVRYTTDGAFVDEHPYPFAEGSMIVAGLDQVIAASDNRHPDRIGYPLHLFDLSTRSVTVSTGSEDGRYAPESSLDVEYKISAVSERPGAVWLARRSELRFELWDVPRMGLETVAAGEVDWFPRATRRFDGTTDPPTTLMDFVVDRRDRIWVLTWVANPEWRDHVVVDPDGVHSWGVDDMTNVWDARLDMYDLRSEIHIPGPVWDDVDTGLTLTADGRPILYRRILVTQRLTLEMELDRPNPVIR